MSVQNSAETAPRASVATDVAVAAQDVSRVYGAGDAAVTALVDATVSFPRGQFAAVMGPSGSGKSTLMHILAGLDRPTTGSVSIDGTEITRLDDRRLTLLRREKIGFVFQFFNLLPMLTAAENLELPLRLGGQALEPGWRRTLVDAVGLGQRLSHRPSELSGGQQQRVAVARALAARPAVVFADEPTGNLDSRTSGAAVADRIVFLNDGRIVDDRADLDAGQILDIIKHLE
jgi:putative ABC transport system ATP-binding protein